MSDYDQYKSRALSLNELVTVSDGSVVSKMILKKKAGNLTLFAFDKGQGLSEHTAPYDALVQVLDGRAEITIGGEPHTVTRGEMVIMPAEVPHDLRAVERFKMMLVMVKG